MTEQAPIVASYVLTLEEIKTVRALYSRRPRAVQIITALIFVAAIGPILIGVLTRRIAVDTESFTPINVALLLVGILLMYGVFRWQSHTGEQRAFVEDPTSNKRVEMRFSQQGIVSSVEGLSETAFQWSGFVRVRRAPQGFLLYQGPHTILWAPEHAFASRADAEAVAALAREHVGDYREQ